MIVIDYVIFVYLVMRNIWDVFDVFGCFFGLFCRSGREMGEFDFFSVNGDGRMGFVKSEVKLVMT